MLRHGCCLSWVSEIERDYFFSCSNRGAAANCHGQLIEESEIARILLWIGKLLGFERRHLHDPWAAAGQRRCSGVRSGAGGCQIFDKIGIGERNDPRSEASPGTLVTVEDGIGSYNKLIGGGCGSRTATGARAVPDCSSRYIERGWVINAAVFENT